MTLPVSRLVQATINLSPTAAATRNFGVLMIAGDSNVISGLERFRSYGGLTDVGGDFGNTTPEYLCAQSYFGQSPPPAQCMIGRFLATASAAQLPGAILTALQQTLSNFTAVTSGGFDVTVDGTSKTLSALNFSAALNLNGVAAIIQTALSGPTCVWNGSQFVISSSTTGAGVAALGTVTFSAAPAANDTVTINGLTITFVAASPTGNQVLIGSSAATSATNLHTFLQASTNADLTVLNFSVSGDVVTIASNSVGTAGNSIAIAKSSTAIAVSGATLSGGTNASSVSYATSPGSGTDISTLLGLTQALALPLVPGYPAEQPVDCVTALADLSTGWFGLHFATTANVTDSQSVAVAAFIEAQDVTRVFGVTTANTGCLSSLVTNDIGSQLLALGYLQSFAHYSSSNPYAAASLMGRAFSVDFTANKSTINLMFKQEPGVIAETLSTSQANVLQAKRINVFVNYNNSTAIIQYGTMAGPAYFDDIQGLDWFQNLVQTACYDLMYTTPTKIPQTDAGMNMFVTACSQACEAAINNGLVAPGTWTNTGFGQLQQGQFLSDGYYIFVQPLAQQSQSDREARKGTPIQIAVKLAGAIQDIDAIITVNR